MDHSDPPMEAGGGRPAVLCELRSTLMNIAGFAGLIRNHRADGARVLRYCDALEKAAERAAALADTLGPEVVVDPSAAKRGGAPMPLRGTTVLLVEDEPAILAMERDLVELHGYPVLTAGDGMEGVEIFREYRQAIGLVVLDLIMPRMDGGRAYLEMKRLDPDLRAFFCTAHTSDELMKSLLEDEHLRALRKPFQADEFLGMIDDAFSDPSSGTQIAS